MGRKRKPPEPKKGAPLWMATFSDLVTLLLTFFVLMMSMANFDDTAKVDAVIESIQEALDPRGYERRLLGSSDQVAFTLETHETQALQPVIVRLREAFSKQVSNDFVKMVEKEQEVRLRLDERAFFRKGSAELHPAAYTVMSDIAGVLATADVSIRVEGYSDLSGDERDNWKLSTDRAVAVVLALRNRGPVDGERIEAVGLGPHHASGTDPAWARRVEIVLKAHDPASRSDLQPLLGGSHG